MHAFGSSRRAIATLLGVGASLLVLVMAVASGQSVAAQDGEPVATLSAPDNLIGTSGPGRGEATLNWDTVAGATGYKVEQRKRRVPLVPVYKWVQLGSEATVTGNSAVVRNLSVNSTHRFRVRALKSEVESEPSNEVSVTLAPPSSLRTPPVRPPNMLRFRSRGTRLPTLLATRSSSTRTC